MVVARMANMNDRKFRELKFEIDKKRRLTVKHKKCGESSCRLSEAALSPNIIEGFFRTSVCVRVFSFSWS